MSLSLDRCGVNDVVFVSMNVYTPDPPFVSSISFVVLYAK